MSVWHLHILFSLVAIMKTWTREMRQRAGEAGRRGWEQASDEEKERRRELLRRHRPKNRSQAARQAQRQRRLGPDGRPLVHSAAQAARMAEMGFMKRVPIDPGTREPAAPPQPVFPEPEPPAVVPWTPPPAELPEPGPMVKALLGVSLEMDRFWPWDEWLGTREEWLEYDRLWKAAKKKP